MGRDGEGEDEGEHARTRMRMHHVFVSLHLEGRWMRWMSKGRMTVSTQVKD